MIRETLSIFAEEMEKRLQEEDKANQPAWETDLSIAIFDTLIEQVDELEEDMWNYMKSDSEQDHIEYMRKCADVGICAMMLFSQVHQLTCHNRRGKAIPIIPKFERVK